MKNRKTSTNIELNKEMWNRKESRKRAKTEMWNRNTSRNIELNTNMWNRKTINKKN